MRIKSNWLGWSFCLVLLLLGFVHAGEPRHATASNPPQMILPEPAVAPSPAGLPVERLQRNTSASRDAITGIDSSSS